MSDDSFAPHAAAVAICNAVGIDPGHCSRLVITVEVGAVSVEARLWIDEVGADGLVEAIKRFKIIDDTPRLFLDAARREVG